MDNPYIGAWLSNIRIELLPDGRRARLIEPLICWLPGGYSMKVPVGFETDFASIPRIFWRVLPPWGRYSGASVVHDWLYRERKLPRKNADQLFIALMQSSGCNAVERVAMYAAVRLFGGFSYNE